MTKFEEELRSAINRTSQENASNTPDYILAQYLNGCLAAFNTAVQQRETWYGRDARPAIPVQPSANDDEEARCAPGSAAATMTG